MRSAVVLVLGVVGVLVALAGLLFTLQGFGAVGGSPMSNTTTWSILGPIIALVGIGIAFAAWRTAQVLGGQCYTGPPPKLQMAGDVRERASDCWRVLPVEAA